MPSRTFSNRYHAFAWNARIGRRAKPIAAPLSVVKVLTLSQIVRADIAQSASLRGMARAEMKPADRVPSAKPAAKIRTDHAIDACLAEMQAPEGLLRRRFFVTRREAIGLLWSRLSRCPAWTAAVPSARRRKARTIWAETNMPAPIPRQPAKANRMRSRLLDDILAGQCRAADCTGKHGKLLAQSSLSGPKAASVLRNSRERLRASSRRPSAAACRNRPPILKNGSSWRSMKGVAPFSSENMLALCLATVGSARALSTSASN